MARLSLCIPTFNRCAFLEWTLNRLIEDFPAAQIVISDNDSSDGTNALAHGYRGYRRQSINIGAFPNMLAALKGATGTYAVYCADDDYLLPNQVAAGIAYLDAHPEVAAYCAPCEIWNEVAQTPFWNAFKVGPPRVFTKTDGLELFNFLISHHVWPEHLIYRTPVPLHARTRAYWAFADLVDLLQAGDLYFDPTPFYRNVLVHPVGEREQLGNTQCLTYFDEYRAGLEVLAHGLFGDQLPYRARHQIQEMISSFICTRMDVARRLYERAGDTDNARMLAARLAIANPVRDAA
jgi:glycosyltransferase involved in cell wall biosynthesis